MQIFIASNTFPKQGSCKLVYSVQNTFIVQYMLYAGCIQGALSGKFF